MSIPVPVDVVGRTISWQPSPSSARLEGEVVRVGFQWPYPKNKEGLRELRRQITVLLPDERVININCEQQDIHRLSMRAEDQGEIAW
jgi:hypothetical protein